MSTFAITGISGNVGGAAARKLLAGPARVRAVVRNEAVAASWRDRGAEAVVATHDDAVALAHAFEGVDGVFVMTPTWFASEDMYAENEKAVSAIGRALRAARTRKVVLLSSIGAQRAQGTGAIMKLHAMERAFSDLPGVTSVRAGWFMENFAGLIPHVRATGELPSMLAPLDRAIPMVATQDIGDLVADLLQQEWSGQRIVELEGPRRYSPQDVAATFATVLDRAVQARALEPGQWHATFRSWGLTDRSAAAMSEMLAAFNTGWIDYEQPATQTLHGATTLDAVLSRLSSN